MTPRDFLCKKKKKMLEFVYFLKQFHLFIYLFLYYIDYTITKVTTIMLLENNNKNILLGWIQS